MLLLTFISVSCGTVRNLESGICDCISALPDVGDYRHSAKHVPTPSGTAQEITVSTILSWPQDPIPLPIDQPRTGRELQLVHVAQAYLENASVNQGDCDIHMEVSQTADKNAPRVIVETTVDSEYCMARQTVQSKLKQHGFQLDLQHGGDLPQPLPVSVVGLPFEDFEHGRGGPQVATLWEIHPAIVQIMLTGWSFSEFEKPHALGADDLASPPIRVRERREGTTGVQFASFSMEESGMKHLWPTIFAALFFTTIKDCWAQTVAGGEPLRIAIAGLVHGHAEGFFQRSLHRPDIRIVGIAEPDQQVALRYVNQFGLDRSLMFADLEDMLQRTHPQAVLAYTNTYDHRGVVEICARHGTPVMMEKPLAVSAEDGHAIRDAARKGKTQVLVNYETSWYRSNRAAYDLVRQKAIGDVRKVVVHDGHQGPREIGVSPEFFAWLTDPRLGGGGALFDFGCYGADLMTWLMDGQRPTTVTAVTQQIKPGIYPRVDDEATIILTYPGAQAILQASWNWPFDRKDMEVYGESGYVMTVRHDDVRVRLQGKEEQTIAAKPIPSPYDDSLAFLRGVILDGIASDGPSSLETNVIVTEILDAARRSAASGKAIALAGDPR